jgi:hypothetical protein
MALSALTFVVCTVTSLTCAVLLSRAYRTTRTRLLLWSAICFFGLTANNAMVFVDLVVFPEVSLVPMRSAIGLVSLLILIVGFIWEGGRSS